MLPVTNTELLDLDKHTHTVTNTKLTPKNYRITKDRFPIEELEKYAPKSKIAAILLEAKKYFLHAVHAVSVKGICYSMGQLTVFRL